MRGRTGVEPDRAEVPAGARRQIDDGLRAGIPRAVAQRHCAYRRVNRAERSTQLAGDCGATAAPA